MSKTSIDACFEYLWSLFDLLALSETREHNVKQIKKMRIGKAVEFFRDWENFILDLERRRDKLDFRKKEEAIDLCFFILRKAKQFKIDVPDPSDEVQSEFDRAVPAF